MGRGGFSEPAVNHGQRWLFDTCEVKDLIPVQDAKIGSLAGKICKRLQTRKRLEPHATAVEKTRRQLKH